MGRLHGRGNRRAGLFLVTENKDVAAHPPQGCQSPTVSRVAATALLGVICMRWGVRGDEWLSSC